MFEAKFEGRDRLRDAGVQMSVMFIFVLRSLRRWRFKRASSASLVMIRGRTVSPGSTVH
jgi:hypothetical protein